MHTTNDIGTLGISDLYNLKHQSCNTTGTQQHIQLKRIQKSGKKCEFDVFLFSYEEKTLTL